MRFRLKFLECNYQLGGNFIFELSEECHRTGFDDDYIAGACDYYYVIIYDSCKPNQELVETVPEEKFLYTIEKNNFNEFENLIDSINVNYRDSAALSLAFYHKRNEIIKILLKKGINCDEIHLRSVLGHIDDLGILQLLLEYTNGKILDLNCDITLRRILLNNKNIEMLKLIYFYHPYSPITKYYYENISLMACIIGSVNVIKFLEEIGVDFRSFNGELLPTASYHGKMDIVKYLLEKGIDVHACNEKALIASIHNDNVEILELLIENGADFHARNNCPIVYAAKFGSNNCIKLLVSYDDSLLFINNNEPIKTAVDYNHVNTVEYFLKSGVDISCCDNYLWCRATAFGNLDMIKLLITYGIDIRCKNNIGIRYACCQEYTDILKLLLEIDPNLITIKNEMIQIATSAKRTEILEFLQKID